MRETMSRRVFLRASPAALALPAALVATAGRASAADPHPALLAEFRRVRDEWNDEIERAGDDTPRTDALWAERTRLAETICSTVATTVAGLLAQVEFMAVEYGGGTGLPKVGLTVNDVPEAFLHTISAGLRRI